MVEKIPCGPGRGDPLSPCPELHLLIQPDLISRFFPLLEGFKVRVQVGCSIRSLLTDQLGIDPEYVEKGLKTIFLDGRPVDDIDRAVVKEGAVLSLSAAMPGLVGTVLRRAGYYSAMRTTITYTGAGRENRGIYEAAVVIKLFNLVQKELGPAFLGKGILVGGRELTTFLDKNLDSIAGGISEVRVDGRATDPYVLRESIDQEEQVIVRVTSCV